MERQGSRTWRGRTMYERVHGLSRIVADASWLMRWWRSLVWGGMLVGLGLAPELYAADKVEATIRVVDALTAPRQAARIEARLVETKLLHESGLGGELLELVVGGKVVATAMTGGDGRGYFDYTPKVAGQLPFTVRLGNSPRVTASEGHGTMSVWEYRRPILLVELQALVAEPERTALPFGNILASKGLAKPAAHAAEELGRLTKFYYSVIYVDWMPGGPVAFQAQASDPREWLKEHQFPMGHVIQVDQGSPGLGHVLEKLKEKGWTRLNAGIGRTRAFAEALVDQRIDVVVVPEPQKGELPRKAKAVKDWKDVRTKL